MSLMNRATAAVLVLDSFTEDDFALSLAGEISAVSEITSPLGSLRVSRISRREAVLGTVLSSTLLSSLGNLSFFAEGGSNSFIPLNLQISYRNGGPFSIMGYDHFEFEFSQIQGQGNLIIELGNPSDIYGPTAHRLSLSSSGIVSVPFDQLNFGSGGSIGSFSSLNIRFEAVSPEFSFTLEEIRLVPEPSALLLVGVAGMALSLRRARSE